MESIARRGAGIVRSLDAVHGKVSRLSTRFAAWVVCLLALMLALPVSATSYVYDANGRLIAVTNDAGESARYVYDVMGNIQKVDRLAADQLALFSVTPGRGVSGMQVRLQGHAFSANAGANLVRFSGVTAAVLTASSSELVVIVPVGAVTGPVSVTVGAQTATSSTDFIVDQNARTPRIDGISPQVASAGTTIKVTGESLYPVAYQTTARIGTRAGVIGAAQNAELDFVVPTFAASGKVSVSTPYGMAVSPQDLFVLPSGIAAANIASFRRIAPDAPASAFSISTTGQQVAILVEAGAGEYLDAQFSGISAGNLGYTLYDPSNRQVVTGTANAGSPTVLLPPAASAGTYLLLIKPAQGPANWNLAIERSRKIAPGDEPVQLSTSIAGQRKRFVFGASVDQRLGLGLEDLSLSSGTIMSASVMSRDTTVVSSTCYVSDGGCQLNIRATQSAVHAIVFTPNTATQTFQAKVSLSNDMRLPLQREVPLDLVVPRRGQNARLFFSAQAGESLALQVMSQTTLPTGRNVNYAVYKPDGTLLTSANATTHQLLNLPSVPQSGEYFVFVDGGYGATSSSRVLLSEGSTSGGQVGGDAGEFETQSGGQSIYFNFTVSEVDQRLGVGISDLVLSSGTYVNVNVYRPDGASAGSTTCYATNGGCDVNLRAPMVGRYSVVVQPINATQTMRLNAWVSNDLQTVMPRETPFQLVIARPGQNARLYIDAEAGESLAIQIAGQATYPAGKTVYYYVYRPDGTLLTSATTTTLETVRLPTLSSGGRYMLFVDPIYGALLEARITLTDGRQSAMEIDAAAGEFIAPIAGHPAYFTFTTATADQRLGLALRDIQLSTGTYVSMYVYGPGGASVNSTTCYPSQGGCELNIRASMVGVYSVVVTPQSPTQLMRFNATLSNDLYLDMMREQPLDLVIGRFGQNARLRFSAEAGENLAVQITGQSSSGNANVPYTIYKPDGTALTSVNTTAFENLRMMKLPASGEYFIFVDPYYGAAMQSRVLLTAGNGGDAIVDGDVARVVTTVGGQATFTTFEVDEVDQRIGIGISDLLVSSGTYATVNVYRPNGSSVVSTSCHQSYDGCDLNLRAPEAGIYGIVVAPQNATQLLDYALTVSNDLRRTLPRETTIAFDVPRRGQNARLTFNAQAGETLGLQIAGQSTLPAARAVSYQVYKPDGTSLTSRSVTSFDTLNLPTLPTSGEYMVFVDPNYGAAVTAQLRLTTGEGTGTEIDGTPGEFSTTQPGQPTYMTFQAAAGEQLSLGISDLVVSSGTYVSVNVYRPGGASAASTNCHVSYQGCALNISAVEGGTYSVVTTPQSASQTTQFKATLSRDLRVSLARNEPLDLAISRRGQRARLSFVGEAGDALALQVAGQSTFPTGRTVNYRVYKPDGAALKSMSATSFGALELRLPAAGTYQVLVETNYGETVSSRITLAEGAVQPVDGDPGEVETSVGGQSMHSTFQATAGEKLGVGIYDLVVSSGSYASVEVYRPDGTSAVSSSCHQSYNGCRLAVSATQTGTYSVAVTPQSGTQTMSYKHVVSRDLVGVLTRNQPLDLVVSRRGQAARLTFTGEAGDALALQVAGQSTFPSARAAYYRVYKPDGTSLKSFSTTSFGAQELRLPVAGTYQVLVETSYGETVSSRITLAAGIVQPVDGDPGEVETSVGGQSMHSTFPATAGEKLGVGIYDLVVSSGSYVSVEVYRPDGTSAVSTTCHQSYNGCRLAVLATQTGTYSVAVTPQSGTQTMSYKHVVSRDLVGVLTRNQPLDLVVSRRGQAARLTFTGEAGDALALQVAGQSTFPSARAAYYRVYKPDGSSLKSFSATAFGAQELRLPVDGTYQVLVETSYGETLSSRMTLAQGEAQPVNGPPGEIQTNVGGQSVHATFQATSGQRLGVGIFDLLVSSGSYASAEVYRPDGTSAVSATCYQSSQGCKLAVTATQTGTYSIVVTPQSATQTLSYKLAVSQELTGVLARDQPLDLVISRRGQNARLTFAGQAGQWLSLQIAGQTTVPAARAIHYRVYRPDGTQLTSVTATAYDALRLPALPAAGEYTVLVDPGQGEAVQSRLTLASGASTLALDGGQAAVSTELGGQEVFLAFNATAGQRVGIGLRDIQLSSGTYFNAEVYRPDGSIVTAACYAQYGGCEMDFTANADGVYRLFVKPQGSTQKIQLTATASTDVQASLERNVLFPLSLARPGQNGWIGFEGASGESLSLQMTDHTTQPSGGNISYVIYKPDGTSLTSANINSSRVLQLPTLTASGTYRIRVNPNYGMPFDVGLTLK